MVLLLRISIWNTATDTGYSPWNYFPGRENISMIANCVEEQSSREEQCRRDDGHQDGRRRNARHAEANSWLFHRMPQTSALSLSYDVYNTGWYFIVTVYETAIPFLATFAITVQKDSPFLRGTFQTDASDQFARVSGNRPEGRELPRSYRASLIFRALLRSRGVRIKASANSNKISRTPSFMEATNGFDVSVVYFGAKRVWLKIFF